ncbi:probable 30S ribosomal protein S15 [Coccomyxa sp. Obi]|nr:probable 30S ribosomal protein S15 [Coccomyxa sp. Obi]
MCSGVFDRGFWSSAAAQRFRPTTAEPRRPDGATDLPPQADLVEKFLSQELMSSYDQRQERIRAAVSRFERFPGDTGSSEVQVAILTEKIYAMAEHMKIHRKDFSSRNGLRGMLAQRRKLLQYLRRSNFDAYSKMLSSLGLKDTYAKQDRLAIRRTRGIETIEV